MPKRSYLIAAGVAVPLLAVLALFAARKANGPDAVTVPAGTAIHVRLNHSLATNQTEPGETFAATLAAPVIVADKTVIPAGAEVKGTVVESQASGRLRGRGYMSLALNTVQVNGTTYDLHTSTVSRVSGNHKTRNIAWIGGGGRSEERRVGKECRL